MQSDNLLDFPNRLPGRIPLRFVSFHKILRSVAVPRFVILHHDHPVPHWDLFLEAGAVLKAWRLFAEPRPDADIPAEANSDHRLPYLDYEGPVSGGRGTVTRVQAGTFAGELGQTWAVAWNGGRATLAHGSAGLIFRYSGGPLLEELG